MEKRRRERINRSLEELKRLVLEAQNRDVSMLCQQKSSRRITVFGLYCFCSAPKFKEMLKLLALSLEFVFMQYLGTVLR